MIDLMRRLANEEYTTNASDDGFLDFREIPGKPGTWAVEFTYSWL